MIEDKDTRLFSRQFCIDLLKDTCNQFDFDTKDVDCDKWLNDFIKQKEDGK